MQQLHQRCEVTDDAFLYSLVSQFPSLPSAIRYHDEYEDQLRFIRDPLNAKRFEIHADGRVYPIPFDLPSESYALLLKQAFVYLLGENLAARTVSAYVLAGKHLQVSNVAKFFRDGPTRVQSCWAILAAQELQRDAYLCMKALLRVMCKYQIEGWGESYHDVISALPLPFLDKYAAVRSGEAFLSINDEAAVVRFLNDAALSTVGSIHINDLRDVAMLVCCYQFGMRPIQIAMLALRDMRVRHEPQESFATVHLTFRMAKQRNTTATKTLLRRVKREWTPIFVEIDRRARAADQNMAGKLFDMKSTHEASQRISSLLRNLTDGGSSARTLRHTAAQRLVDAGASQEELAEFLGHTDSTTGLVYYETSANQADRVNRALGISDIYQRVAKIAHDRFIDAEELARLKESQQIGGAPHGVAIAGIGGCTSGQAACPYNPVMACYGCKRFMPVHDIKMHAEVLSEFRGIARFFLDASRGDAVSPTYLQLERTISEVQAVVNELDEAMS
jgi:integrase